MNKVQHRIFKAFYFLITSFVLVAPALYNRYPLMYFDSGAYMEMALNFEPSFHRALGYPLLIRLTGLLVTNWPLIIIQGLVLSILIYKIIQPIVAKSKLNWIHFASVVILSFSSAISWYAAQLMPDIWTLILVLAVAGLIINRGLSSSWLWFYGILQFFALLTHLSHIPLMFLLLISIGALWLISNKQLFRISKKYWIALITPFLLAAITVPSFNSSFGYGFRFSLASNAFITANLGEMGVLKMYLDENCDQLNSGLCDIKDELPLETSGYLWDSDSPVQTHPEGWAGANEEYAVIVKDFMSKPRYMKWFVFSAIKATVKQMFQIEIGSGLQYAYGEGSSPYWPMKSHFKQELNEYLVSVQNKGDKLPLDFFRIVNYLSLVLSILIIGWAVLQRKLSTELAALLVLFLLAYILNASITGVLANVYERLQVRLLPLIQFFAILVFIKLVRPKISATER
mgnify:CR=1 FL=1